MQENTFANALYMLLLALCVLFTQAARAEVTAKPISYTASAR